MMRSKIGCDRFLSDLFLSDLFLSDLSLLGLQRYAYSTVADYHPFNNMTVHIIMDKKGEAMFYSLRVRYWWIDDCLYHFAGKYTEQLSKQPRVGPIGIADGSLNLGNWYLWVPEKTDY